MKYSEAEKGALRQIFEDFRSNTIRIYEHLIFSAELCLSRIQDIADEVSSVAQKTPEQQVGGAVVENWNEWNQKRANFDQEQMRTAIVLLHASLECALREVLRISICKYPDVLSKVPYFGGDGRATKLSLGVLARYKGQSIDEYIQNSVNQYLDRKTFSSVTDIASDFRELSVNLERLGEYLPCLEQVIERRHQIVHRLDLLHSSSKQKIGLLTKRDVQEWSFAVYMVVLHIVSSLLEVSYKELVGDEIDILNQYFGQGIPGIA